MRMLLAIPLTILPLLAYAFIAAQPQGIAALDTVWLSQAMISGGTVSLTQGDVLMGFAILVLFLEVVKATRTGFAPVMDHVLSVLMVMVYLVLFIVWAPAATALFGLLTLVALVDALAGLWISLNVARRDVAISPGGSFWAALDSASASTNANVNRGETAYVGGRGRPMAIQRPTQRFAMSALSTLKTWFLVPVLSVGLPLSAPAAQTAADGLTDQVTEQFGAPPAILDGPISEALESALQVAFVDSFENREWSSEQGAALEQIVQAGDVRAAWVIADMMRFAFNGSFSLDLAVAASRLSGVQLQTTNNWHHLTDHLIAWDVPAFPGYLAFKRAIFTGFVPGWDALFVEGDIDWRLVSWGGVLIDARAHDATDDLCNCIPAADNPQVVDAVDAVWPADDDVVFGVVLNGEARAYPRQIMEVREMVNDTLGGRDLAIPYCTLCGAAQAYFTDRLPEGIERPIMRTSGLLIRSNKVMYDLVTNSVFDTFLGNAVTGPLADIGLQLEQATVVTTTWGRWKEAHPQTTVLEERYALGRDPDFRNGRDANGPIFPVGDVDPRLPVHEDVVGVITTSGTPWAFQRAPAVAALLAGQDIEVENVRLVLEAGGLRAVDVSGEDIGSHQAFWFAWSQFHPDTQLWIE